MYSFEHGDFKPSPERTTGIYSKHRSINDKLDDLYYCSTFIKFVIGCGTFDTSKEIRHGEITREEGVKLVKMRWRMTRMI